MTEYIIIKNAKKRTFIVANDLGWYTLYHPNGSPLDAGVHLKLLIERVASTEAVYYKEGYKQHDNETRV